MRSKRIAVMVGTFMAILCAIGIAARFEDLTIGKLRVENTLTCESTVGITGELTVDGKYTATGPDATTGLMVQAAAVTAIGTLETNTFTVAFGAAPVVSVSYTEDPGDVRPIFLGTITASNFTCTVASSKNYSYTAVGARP